MADRIFRTLLEQHIRERCMTFEEFVEHAEVFARDHGEPGTLSLRHLQRLTRGRAPGTLRPATARLLERIFGEPISTLLAPPKIATIETVNSDGEQEALELARRVAASDVGDETVSRLELTVDELATSYPITPPAELLVRVRQQLGYVAALLNARKTLREHHRLLVTAGWLSLLAATLHIDLKQQAAAAGWLATAASLARQTGHDEIHAWRYETEAWQVLIDGEYRRAVELAQTAQRIAPRGGSAVIQATAQEGRAWARLGEPRDTYTAIDRVHTLAGALPRPGRPEHHYRYDPTKAIAYTATTLSWVGDPAAEGFARDVINRLGKNGEASRWPRRVATANLDLALTLLVTDRLDEAAEAARSAMLSGMVVPSNHWRALEVVTAVEARGFSEAPDLREAYELMRQG